MRSSSPHLRRVLHFVLDPVEEIRILNRRPFFSRKLTTIVIKRVHCREQLLLFFYLKLFQFGGKLGAHVDFAF
jgi:hypothetical protein